MSAKKLDLFTVRSRDGTTYIKAPILRNDVQKLNAHLLRHRPGENVGLRVVGKDFWLMTVVSRIVTLPSTTPLDLSGIAFPGEIQDRPTWAKNTTRGIHGVKTLVDIASAASSCSVM